MAAALLFYDLSLLSDDSSSRLVLSARALELGYAGVALDHPHRGILGDSHRCSTQPFAPLSSLPLPASAALHRRRLASPTSQPFRQCTRITLSIDSPATAASALAPSAARLLRTYDIVAARPLNQAAFDYLCQVPSCSQHLDLISIDFSRKLPFRLKLPMLKLALQRGLHFEIAYSPSIAATDGDKCILADAKLLADWTKGKNLIISSAAHTATQIRGPYDVINLCSYLLGLPMNRAKAAISTNPRSLILRALRKKHFYKETIRVDRLLPHEQLDSTKVMLSDWVGWDSEPCKGQTNQLESSSHKDRCPKSPKYGIIQVSHHNPDVSVISKASNPLTNDKAIPSHTQDETVPADTLMDHGLSISLLASFDDHPYSVEGKVETNTEDKEDPHELADKEDREEQNVGKVEVIRPVVADNREQNRMVDVAQNEIVSNNPAITQNMEQPIKKVYVGGIPYYSSEDDIRSFFEGCGSITAIDCMTFPESGKFRGIAILTFETDAAAQRALALDGADMGGFYLKIQPYEYSKSDREVQQKEGFAPKLIEGYNRIYAGNLPWDITEDDIRKFFSDCKISSIRFGTDKETGDFKGYAHVDFSDGTSLAVALKLDQKVIKGCPVRIRCAVPKKDNQKVNDEAIPPHTQDETVPADILMDHGLSISLSASFDNHPYKPGCSDHVLDDFVQASSVDLKNIDKCVEFDQDAMEVDETESCRLNLVVGNNIPSTSETSIKVACSAVPRGVEISDIGLEDKGPGHSGEILNDARFYAQHDTDCVSDEREKTPLAHEISFSSDVCFRHMDVDQSTDIRVDTEAYGGTSKPVECPLGGKDDKELIDQSIVEDIEQTAEGEVESTDLKIGKDTSVEPLLQGQEINSTHCTYLEGSTDAYCESGELKEQISAETVASLQKNIDETHEQSLPSPYPSSKVEVPTFQSEKRRRKLRSHHSAYVPFLGFIKSAHFKRKVFRIRDLVKPM